MIQGPRKYFDICLVIRHVPSDYLPICINNHEVPKVKQMNSITKGFIQLVTNNSIIIKQIKIKKDQMC